MRIPAQLAASAEILADARPTMRLDRVVDDLQRHVRRLDLDHRDLALGGLVAGLVHHVRGLQAEEPRHLDLDPRLGDALFPDAVLGRSSCRTRRGSEPLAHRPSASSAAPIVRMQ